jgi:hypothetical protein
MKPQLTEFEWKMFHLMQIGNRLTLISNNLESLPRITHQSDSYDILSVVREYAVIQLANFLDIKKAMESDPALSTKRYLKKSLEPLVASIVSRKDTIFNLRNYYYAHVGDKQELRFDGWMEDVIEDNFPKNFEEIVFLGTCVGLYVQYFSINFMKAWSEMTRKIEDYRPVVKGEPRRTTQQIKEEVCHARLLVVLRTATAATTEL